MKTSSIVKPNEDFIGYIKSFLKKEQLELKIYAVYDQPNDEIFTEIYDQQILINSIDDFMFKFEFQLPGVDCYCLIICENELVVLRVGKPKLKVFYKNKIFTPNLDLTLDQFEFGGTIIDTLPMKEIEETKGVYYTYFNYEYSSLIKIYGEEIRAHYEMIKIPYASGGDMNGKIILQPDSWQMISIPVKRKLYEYFLVPLADKYGVQPVDLIEVCNAYPATPSQSGEFLSFVTGVTNPLTKHNYYLIMDDGDSQEILGFWVKTKDYLALTNNEVITFEWDKADGE